MEKILNVKIHNQTEEVASKAKNEARNTAKNPHMAMFVLFAVLFNILAFVVPANANDLWGSRMSAYKVGCGIGCAVLAWCLLHLRDIIREPSLIGAYQMSYDKQRTFKKRGIIASIGTVHSEFPENFLDISDMNSMPRNICNIIKRKLVN